MKVVIGTCVDKINEHHIPLWLAHHNRYASKLVLVVDVIEKRNLSPQIYRIIEEYPKCIVHFLPFKWNEGSAYKFLHSLLEKESEEGGWVGIINIDEVFSDQNFMPILKEEQVDWLSFPTLRFYGDYFTIRVVS